MATPTLDFGAFSPSELQALLTAAKAEFLVRITGRVQQGSSAAQSYGLQFMTVDDLTRLINGVTMALGLDAVETRVTPNFNSTAYTPPGASGYWAP